MLLKLRSKLASGNAHLHHLLAGFHAACERAEKSRVGGCLGRCCHKMET